MYKVFMNGEFMNQVDAKISIYDSALMFGDMVFEMTRSFNKTQFKLEEHIDRLIVGLKILRIDIPYSKSNLIEICHEVIEMNEPHYKQDDENRMMIDLSRGLLGIYKDIPDLHSGPNVIVADFPLRWTVRGMGALFDQGINAVITSQRAIPSKLDPRSKSRSFILFNGKYRSFTFEGDNLGPFLDPDGYIAETGDNFHCERKPSHIAEEEIYLRNLRDFVFDSNLSSSWFNFIEKNIEPYDVYTADEAFMTGTPFCMLPVTKLNGLSIGDGKVGGVFNKM